MVSNTCGRMHFVHSQRRPLQTQYCTQLVGNPVIGRLCDVHGAKVALQMCQLATGISYVLLGVSSDIPQLFLSRLPTVLMQSMHCAQVCSAAVQIWYELVEGSEKYVYVYMVACICVCTCIYTYICVYIGMYIYVCICICIDI